MYDIAIILASQDSERHALRSLLAAHRADLRFVVVANAKQLSAISQPFLARARLIAFATDIIVTDSTLGQLGYGAYNFHPGPPSYPGWAPAHFALYDGASSFGATAHVMTERVDAGPIVGVETFAVPAGMKIRELEQIAYIRMARLFWRLSEQLATSSAPLPILPIDWGTRRSTKRMYSQMCDISTDITHAELTRRLWAFCDDFRKVVPTITLHGVKFRLNQL